MTVEPINPDAEAALNQPPPEATEPLLWQLVVPIALAGVGVLILAASSQFPDTAAAQTSPGLYPGVVSTVLILAALLAVAELLLIRRRHQDRPRSTPRTVDATEQRSSRVAWYRAVGVTLLSIGYVILIPHAGFVVTTFIYCFIISAMLTPRTSRGLGSAALIAAGLVAMAYYAFAVGLNAPLPRGSWF